jgi:hypothetical protein
VRHRRHLLQLPGQLPEADDALRGVRRERHRGRPVDERLRALLGAQLGAATPLGDEEVAAGAHALGLQREIALEHEQLHRRLRGIVPVTPARWEAGEEDRVAARLVAVDTTNVDAVQEPRLADAFPVQLAEGVELRLVAPPVRGSHRPSLRGPGHNGGMDLIAGILLVVFLVLGVVVVIGLFVWAAVKDGQQDQAVQRRLGIRRRTRLGR